MPQLSSRRVTRRSRLTTGAIGAAAASALLLTGCSQSVDGHPQAFSDPSCRSSGFGSVAAGNAVSCYLHAVGAGDLHTACTRLSQRVREQIAEDGRKDGFSSAYRPADPSTPSADGSANCTDVAGVMRHAFDSLPREQMDGIRHALRDAQVGRPELTGTRASVPLTLHYRGRSKTGRVVLVREAGSWRIDSDGAFQTG